MWWRRRSSCTGADGASEEETEQRNRKGMLFAAGMITGEALMGILIAVPIVTSGRADVLALPESLHFGGWLGLLVFAALALWLYRVAIDRGVVTDRR